MISVGTATTSDVSVTGTLVTEQMAADGLLRGLVGWS